ncbi:ADP-ribosylation factor-like protein 13B [Pycnococcus provasolii]
MFTLARNLVNYLREKSEKRCRLICVGLDGAGKTTLVGAASNEPVGDTVAPTMGFQKASVTTGRFHVDVYDLGGGKRIRGIWKEYTAEVHGTVFVVDAANKDRFDEAREVLHATLKDDYMSGKPLLIFANKQDLEGAASSAALAEALKLPSVADVRFHVVECSAKGATDPNIAQGLKWLLGAVESDFRKLNKRVEVEGAAMRERQEREKEERRKRAAAAREERRRQREREAAEAEAEAEAAKSATSTVALESTADTAASPPKVAPSPPKVAASPQNEKELLAVTPAPRAVTEASKEEEVVEETGKAMFAPLPGTVASPTASVEISPGALGRPELLPPLNANAPSPTPTYV